MIGGPNLPHVRVEPTLAQYTGTTATATQSTILFSSGLHVQSGLRDSSA